MKKASHEDWELLPIIPALRKLRQDDCHELDLSQHLKS